MSEPEVYREPPRGYLSLLWIVGGFGAGFLIDLALGGGGAHAFAWVAATAIVAGLWALVLHAVRSEKSLVVTATELRVGEDALGREEVAGFAPAVDEEELPVLGWPRGKPRQLRGVTLRLTGGQDVVVPTRFPDRLREALGLAEQLLPARGQEVRAAARSELRELDDIGDRADTLFRLAGYELPAIPYDAGHLAKAKAVFVAGRPPIGFVWVREVDGLAHVEELAVIPKWMGQGIGSRLLERACEWAADHEYPAVTLCTFADVPWNGPFYAARGFVEVDEADLGAGLAAVRAHERELGLDAVARRIVMRRALG